METSIGSSRRSKLSRRQKPECPEPILNCHGHESILNLRIDIQPIEASCTTNAISSAIYLVVRNMLLVFKGAIVYINLRIYTNTGRFFLFAGAKTFK
jgi:hypothetical protein